MADVAALAGFQTVSCWAVLLLRLITAVHHTLHAYQILLPVFWPAVARTAPA